MENKTKITAFKVKKIPLSKVDHNKNYEVGVSVSNWDKNRYFVILKVANKVHNDLDKDGLVKVNLYYDESFANDNNYHTLVTFTMVAQIYDAEQDKIIDTKKQDYYLNEKTKEFISYSQAPVNTVEGSIQAYWHKNKLVEKVEGPFSDADCKTIVSEVKIGTRYYFRATPKQKLHKSELLAMKWSYRYDDDEITPFNYAIESAKGNVNIMNCVFHKQPKEIKVYAFYKSPSDKVSVKFNVFGAIIADDSPTEESNTASSCDCGLKQNQFHWSNKISCEERKKVLQICSELWGEENKVTKASELMSIIHLESGGTFSPSADNGVGYTGLIQFSDATAKSLGTSRRELKEMTFVNQLDYVKRYFEKQKDNLNTMTDMYLMVLKPNAVGKGNQPNYVVFDESIEVPDNGIEKDPNKRKLNINKEPWVTKFGYTSNPAYMLEKDEKKKREHWHYTSQSKKMRYGLINGKTYIWEVEKVLTDEHFVLGKNEVFEGACNSNSPTDNNTAEWVKVAFGEFKKYKGKIETESPLKEKISSYFKSTGNPTLKHSDAWCAAFINWCFDQTENFKNTNTKGTAAAYDWAEYNNAKVKGDKYKDGWKNGEKCEAFVGAVIVFDWSHVAFIVGENIKGDKYVYLGGNQTGTQGKKSGTQVISMSSISKKSGDILAIMKPKKYTIKDEDKVLPKYDVNQENSYESTR